MASAPRKFEAIAAVRQEEPFLMGVAGPPGGGKTLSSLRLAKGMQSVRGGPIILIDTEGGRSRKFAEQIPFECCEFAPPCKPEDFLAAIQQQLPRRPAAIIVDSMSDEHEGEGGYLEWHDEMVPKMSGNDWAAWAKPKASRKRLISGILHIKTPLIFTFRAREKTKQGTKANGKTEIVNIGWMPVAPLEIVHTLDLTCILPPRANGVPTWHSDKVGEDFIIKLPNYLAPFIEEGKPLCEEMGAAFARWAKGDASTSSPRPQEATDQPAPSHQPPPRQPGESGAGRVHSWEDYVERWVVILDDATDAKQLHDTWSAGRAARNSITWPDDDTFDKLKARVEAKITGLKGR